MNQPLLQAHSISKAFYYPKKVNILNGLNLQVSEGSSVAIMGKSGEGKSTLLQVLGTLDDPCDGFLEIKGIRLSRFNKSRIRNKHIAFVFQSFHLLDDYTALENVLMPARIAGCPTGKGSPMHQRGLHLLEQMGLKDRAHFHSKFLSGGEKQRVAIARAFCNDPSLIFADEPSGNLDADTSLIITKLLLDFSKQPGKALIVVTHDENLANQCSVRYQLNQGSLDNVCNS